MSGDFMWIFDQDYYEIVSSSGPGWASQTYRARPEDEVRKIKNDKQRAHEEAVLAEAAAIMARRTA